MKITIIALYRGEMCEHSVGVVKGSLTEEEKKEIAARFDLEGGRGRG